MGPPTKAKNRANASEKAVGRKRKRAAVDRDSNKAKPSISLERAVDRDSNKAKAARTYSKANSTMGLYVEFCEKLSLPIADIESVKKFLTFKSHKQNYMATVSVAGVATVVNLESKGCVSTTTPQIKDQLLSGARNLVRLNNNTQIKACFGIKAWDRFSLIVFNYMSS